MNATTDALAPPRRIGLLTPFAELPGEYADVVAEGPDRAIMWQVVTEAPDSHHPEHLIAIGSPEALAVGARRLLRWRPDIVMWACTSGSFIGGRASALAQQAALEAVSGVPSSSTSLAFVEALQALGVREVEVISPYPIAATKAFVSFLGEWGVSVRRAAHLDHPTGRSSGAMRLDDLRPHLSGGRPSSLLLVPDTAVWGFELLAGLEAIQDARPVLVANQVTLWKAFRMAGLSTANHRFGLLQDRG